MWLRCVGCPGPGAQHSARIGLGAWHRGGWHRSRSLQAQVPVPAPKPRTLCAPPARLRSLLTVVLPGSDAACTQTAACSTHTTRASDVVCRRMSRTVFVGNLPLDTREREIEVSCSSC